MRGEYAIGGMRVAIGMELPPRARRIQLWIISRLGSEGTTSACAENTHAHPQKPPTRGNYLRVRGEYSLEG